MKILFVDPHESSLFSFRKELLDALIENKHQIILCSQITSKTREEYSGKVYKLVDVQMDLKSKSIFSNTRLKKEYKRIIKIEKPDLIISYKIKPNIYCGMYSKDIPMIANITGLGNIFKKSGLLSKIGTKLYKRSFKNVDYVFFQNEDGYNFFVKKHIPVNNYKIIPGSGVNVEIFNVDNSPLLNKSEINFLFASRGIKEKGFNLLLDAIPEVIKKTNNVHFNFISAEEDILSNKKARNVFNEYKNYISVFPRFDDMNLAYSQNHFLVSPSFYREGISNILLESLMCGRPIITTRDNPGCKEVLQEDINGYGVNSNDLQSLIDAIIKAANTPLDRILEMGLNGREYVSKYFDRKIVINEYLSTIKQIERARTNHGK